MERLLPIIAAVLLAPVGGAQDLPSYDRSRDDTLRYREVTESVFRVNTPQGAFDVENFHDATIALTFVASYTARAVYEALELVESSPAGDEAPETKGALGLPFVLTFPPDGRVETVSVPEFPDVVDAVTDLRWQFSDFFLPLPDEPLYVGLVWADSTHRVDVDEDGREMVVRKVGEFRVVSDTTVGNRAALVIASFIREEAESEGLGPEPGLMTRTLLASEEHGQFVFAPEPGLLLSRERVGVGEGRIEYVGDTEPFVLPQRYDYVSRFYLME